MKTLIAMTMLMALGLVLPTIAADKQDLENRVKQLNSVGAKPEMQDIAFQRISTETGVPVETVRKQHQRHTIAQQNNVSVDKLNERLDRLAKAISG
jgi:predicted site-specific integrase-resolvase